MGDTTYYLTADASSYSPPNFPLFSHTFKNVISRTAPPNGSINVTMNPGAPGINRNSGAAPESDPGSDLTRSSIPATLTVVLSTTNADVELAAQWAYYPFLAAGPGEVANSNFLQGFNCGASPIVINFPGLDPVIQTPRFPTEQGRLVIKLDTISNAAHGPRTIAYALGSTGTRIVLPFHIGADVFLGINQ